mmetsp:Transcript_30539/g.64344  ORF Transcript_30539/g.64344 Transcript_30539/m.64344 type:complete len:175 (+) Transcript_30539:47-571(+)|eukprot:CAMPEP_0171347756 /NCGR_PEP_ID=MMETSP0878-20121228/28888_1 /TAXON_ID=67004 /ORGANISM="Thalassiosira weissflogii, Strain CCMP1336" /LENGTH=174 /DNA_ID=CAMNT_0011851883 /DNA_START=45 /DNA_END=569 /DNA_ORIENTATION=+
MDMDIVALSNLLHDHDDTNSATDKHGYTPGNLGNARNQEPAECISSTPPTQQFPTRNSIWAAEEIQSADAVEETEEKSEPNHQIYYKRVVGFGDTFGMSGMSSYCSDCSHIVVKVSLPGCHRDEISLDVTKDKLVLETDNKKLELFMPQQVHGEGGTAEWDKDSDVLSVCLPFV